MHDIQWEILLGAFGLIFSIIYMHYNTTNRIDEQGRRIEDQGQRIDNLHRDFNAIHKEIMEMIKKMK